MYKPLRLAAPLQLLLLRPSYVHTRTHAHTHAQTGTLRILQELAIDIQSIQKLAPGLLVSNCLVHRHTNANESLSRPTDFTVSLGAGLDCQIVPSANFQTLWSLQYLAQTCGCSDT